MKKIEIDVFSSESIENAIKQLDSYAKEIERKTELLRIKVAERIATEVEIGFRMATTSDMVKGSPPPNDTSVYVRNEGNTSVIVANGTQIMWIEFGAGVYHNGSVGSSPHPKGSELGMVIGGYGKGRGKRRVWGYVESEGDELKLTRGTPAQMPMLKAVNTVLNEIPDIAKEVFK